MSHLCLHNILLLVQLLLDKFLIVQLQIGFLVNFLVSFRDDYFLDALAAVLLDLVECLLVNLDFFVFRPDLQLIGFEHLQTDLAFEEDAAIDHGWHLTE